jgi:hypothetical protein
MTKETALAAAATLVAAAFTLSTLDRWLAHRRRHEAAWTLALAMFTIASASLWVAAVAGWTEPTFRIFYLFGAILNVPWLALGTVELLGGPRWGRPCTAGVALLSAFAAGVMAVTPFVGPIVADELPEGSDVFGPLPRVLAAVCSGGAALVIVAGALWSAWRALRGGRRVAVGRRRAAAGWTAAPGRFALGNVLIAGGTLVLSASGTLNARLGAETAFAVTLATGVTVLFVGFLVATSASATRTDAPGLQRNARRSTLPPRPLGRASTTSTEVGHL